MVSSPQRDRLLTEGATGAKMVQTPGGTILDYMHSAGSSGGKGQKSRPPKPNRMQCSPAAGGSAGSCKDVNMRHSSCLKGPKYMGTPGAASAGSIDSAGAKFSFGLHCMLSLAKSSPSAFLTLQPQHSGGTPNLFLAGGGRRETAESCASAGPMDVEDTAACSDTKSAAKPDVFLDMDLLQHRSIDEMDSAVMSLSEDQRQQVQRLLCNPRVLSLSAESFEVLKRLPALQFLILSLDHMDEASLPSQDPTELVNLWAGLPQLLKSLPHVVCLDMSNCLMQDQHLQAISACCTQLRALDLSYSPHLTEAGIAPLVSACSSLEELDLSTCPAALTDRLLSTLAGRCPSVSSLYLDLDAAHAYAIGYGAGRISGRALAALARSCPGLQAVSLTGLPIASEDAASSMAELAQACPQLASLDLSGCSWLDSTQAWQALAACSSLQTLALSGGGSFDDQAALQLARGCPALSSLSLQDCSSITDEGVIAMVQALQSSLAELSLVDCPLLTHDELAAQLEHISASLQLSLHASAEQDASAASPSRDQGTVAGAEAAGKQQPAEAAPAWGSLMSFLSNNVEKVGLASANKAKRR